MTRQGTDRLSSKGQRSGGRSHFFPIVGRPGGQRQRQRPRPQGYWGGDADLDRLDTCWQYVLRYGPALGLQPDDFKADKRQVEQAVVECRVAWVKTSCRHTDENAEKLADWT